MKKLNFKIIALVIAGMTSGVNAAEMQLAIAQEIVVPGVPDFNFFQEGAAFEEVRGQVLVWVQAQIENLQQNLSAEQVRSFDDSMIALRSRISDSCQGKPVGDVRTSVNGFIQSLGGLGLGAVKYYLFEEQDEPIAEKRRYSQEDILSFNQAVQALFPGVDIPPVDLIDILFPIPLSLPF